MLEKFKNCKDDNKLWGFFRIKAYDCPEFNSKGQIRIDEANDLREIISEVIGEAEKLTNDKLDGIYYTEGFEFPFHIYYNYPYFVKFETVDNMPAIIDKAVEMFNVTGKSFFVLHLGLYHFEVYVRFPKLEKEIKHEPRELTEEERKEMERLIELESLPND